MAVTIGSHAAVLKRSANVPPSTGATLWGWFKRTSDPNTYHGCLGLNNGLDGSAFRAVNTDADGTTLKFYANGAGVEDGYDFTVQPSADEWFFVALVLTGDNTGHCRLRTLTQNVLSSTTSDMTTGGSFTSSYMELGGDGYTAEYFRGNAHALGAVDVALSDDELLWLSYYHEPQLAGIRSLNVFYPTIESVNTNVIVDRSGNTRDATATAGALADSPPLLWRPVRPYTPVNSASSSNVTLGVTGVASTCNVGSVAPSRSIAVTGNAATASVGSLALNHSQALTGNASSCSVGNLIAALSKALTGNEATGQVGSLGPAGDLALSLTGVSSTASVGSFALNASFAVTGNVATIGVGTLGVNHSQPVTGNAATCTVGNLAPSFALALAGNEATGQVGTLGAAGDAERALTGVAASGSVGSLALTHGQALTGVAASTTVGSLASTRSALITGVVATCGVGSVVPANSVSLLGNAASAQVGTLGPDQSNDSALTGVFASCGVGSFGVGRTQAITGMGCATTVGSLIPSLGIPLGGNEAVCSVGTVDPSTVDVPFSAAGIIRLEAGYRGNVRLSASQRSNYSLDASQE